VTGAATTASVALVLGPVGAGWSAGAAVRTGHLPARPDTGRAAAGQAWSVEQTPNYSLPQGNLAAVSCASRTSCVAVGYAIDSSGAEVTLAEHWNGSTWRVQATASPRRATSSSLDGVSCRSATACTAVGSYVSSSGSQRTLAEAWNGSTWHIQTTPNPAGPTSGGLSGVSCPSATACIAVGFYYDSTAHADFTLAEAWNGSKWKIQTTALPAGAISSGLDGVSCRSATDCTAVGFYQTDPATQSTLAEAWDGTSWQVLLTPNPASADISGLSGVSCRSATACTAVGSSHDTVAHADVTLAEAWNGTTWQIRATPEPAGATSGSLAGVSCGSATACTAVGTYGTTSGIGLTLAEAWNGTSWHVEATPSPASASVSSLVGVSCRSATACTSVGSDQNSLDISLTLAQAWNGSSWKTQRTPSPVGATESYLDSVSCRSSTACIAVGAGNVSIDGVSLAADWIGTSWKLQHTPGPAGATFSYLSSVSCRSVTGCVAVGDYGRSGQVFSFAEVRNGTGWKLRHTPLPAGAASSGLDGVSCSSATACTAVGDYHTRSDADYPLAQRWNGSSWKIQHTPHPAGTISGLGGVSCSSATACIAVGSYLDPVTHDDLTLAEVWNGSSWKIQHPANPAGATESVLSAVSCHSATACIAVGSYLDPVTHDDLTLAEAWNGSTWKIQTMPALSAGLSATLRAVSCQSAVACTAVGSYYDPALDNIVMLAEAWNGTSWQITTPRHPGRTTPSELSGVSCPAAGTCTAVGNYQNSSGNEVTLAEGEHG